MTTLPHDLSYFNFADFDASHIDKFQNMLANSTFTPSDKWKNLPRFEAGLSVKPNDENVNTRYAILAGDTADGTHIECFIGQLTVYSKKKDSEIYESQIITRMFVDVHLPFQVPHIRILPQSEKIASLISLSSNSSIVSLEGDFGKFFTVLATKGSEVAAYEVLPPDTMLHLLSNIPHVSLEYEEGHIFITVPLDFSYLLKKPTGFNGQTALGRINFNDTWLSFYDKLFTVFKAVPELVDSAKTANLSGLDFAPMNNERLIMGGTAKAKTIKSVLSFVFITCIVLFVGSIISTTFGLNMFEPVTSFIETFAPIILFTLPITMPLFIIGGVIFFAVVLPRKRKRLLEKSGYKS